MQKYVFPSKTGSPSCLTPLAVDGDELKEVEEFVYLGSLVTAENNTSKVIRKRILAGNRAYFGLRKTLRSGRVRRHTKLTLYKTLIRPVVLYGHESWTMLAEDQRALGVFERKVRFSQSQFNYLASLMTLTSLRGT